MYAAQGVSLGRLSVGYSGLISVELFVPVSLGPEVMNTLCAVEWRFAATQYNDVPYVPPGPPETPSSPGTPTDPGTPPASGTGTGVSTVPVIDDTPISELPDSDSPTTPGSSVPDIEIDASPTPTTPASGARAWALANLVLTIVSGLLMAGLLVRWLFALLGREKDEDEKDAQHAAVQHAIGQDAANQNEERAKDRRTARRGVVWLGAIVCVVATVLLFIFTEDMRLPMEIINRYTIFYVLAVLIELVLFALSFKKRKTSQQSQSK
jgi:hypothetical protein